jgi:hypothetical protein
MDASFKIISGVNYLTLHQTSDVCVFIVMVPALETMDLNGHRESVLDGPQEHRDSTDAPWAEQLGFQI